MMNLPEKHLSNPCQNHKNLKTSHLTILANPISFKNERVLKDR